MTVDWTLLPTETFIDPAAELRTTDCMPRPMRQKMTNSHATGGGRRERLSHALAGFPRRDAGIAKQKGDGVAGHSGIIVRNVGDEAAAPAEGI